MIEAMNNSGMFQAELRGQDLQKTESIYLHGIQFAVIYTPRYGYNPAVTSDVALETGRKSIMNENHNPNDPIEPPVEPEMTVNEYGTTKDSTVVIEEETRTVLLTER